MAMFTWCVRVYCNGPYPWKESSVLSRKEVGKLLVSDSTEVTAPKSVKKKAYMEILDVSISDNDNEKVSQLLTTCWS
jgi:hypothetical protein